MYCTIPIIISCKIIWTHKPVFIDWITHCPKLINHDTYNLIKINITPTKQNKTNIASGKLYLQMSLKSCLYIIPSNYL